MRVIHKTSRHISQRNTNHLENHSRIAHAQDPQMRRLLRNPGGTMDGEGLRSGEGQFRGLLCCPIRGHSVFAFVNEDRDTESWGYVELRKESKGVEFRENAAKGAPWRELRHPVVCVACRTRGTLRHFDEQGMALEMCVAD